MPEAENRRPTPEELLRRVEAEERATSRGKLKIFLGYASGVGKSFRMLDEGRRRRMRGQETIPDWVVKRADEIVLVDLPPLALLNRLQRGVVYAPEKARQALQGFFKEHVLSALREIAMRQTAHEVDVRQIEPAPVAVSTPSPGASPTGSQPEGLTAEPERERILIHVSDAPWTAALIRRGRRVADYLKADCFAVCILPAGGLDALPPRAREATEKHLDFARKLHIETRLLEGKDRAQVLVDFARRNGVTQIFLAKPATRSLSFLAVRDLVMKVVRLAKDMQVTVVADRRSREVGVR